MMQLASNKSQIWYKVFNRDFRVTDSSKEYWEFPLQQGEEYQPTQVLEFSKVPAYNPLTDRYQPPHEGTWLLSDPYELYQPREHLLAVASLIEAPTYELEGIIWVRRVRLLRFANTLDFRELKSPN